MLTVVVTDALSASTAFPPSAHGSPRLRARSHWEPPVRGPTQRRHLGRTPTHDGRETPRERRARLLCETDTVLTAINDLLTANCCNSATTETL